MTSAENSENKAPGLLYVADPMCSWCWGFTPVIRSIAKQYGNRLPIWIIVGGLSPGETTPLSDNKKASIREHWDHVHEATGQPFDYKFFEREDFIYDTEPPSRAVVATRQIDPFRTRDFLELLHGAFYRDNRDITDTKTLAKLAQEFGFDRQEFFNVLESEAVKKVTKKDFITSRKMGIRGFPSLVGHADNNQLSAISNGYRPWEDVNRDIKTWLKQFVER